MHKKLITACLAITAVAAFIAPMALASPLLTNSGVAVPVGTSITGKNTGFIKFTTAGFNMECSSVDLNGTVTSNTGTKIKGEIPASGFSITGTGAGGDCTSALGAVKVTVNSKVCLETVEGTDNIKFTGCGANYTATLEITGAGPCKYSTASVTAAYLTNAGATVNVLEQPTKKEEGGIFCPAEGKADDDLDLYATGGTPQLTIS